MKIKICGITNRDDALLSADEGADALGFIFTDKSPRCIDIEKAASITGGLPFLIQKIGVFADMEPDEVNRISNEAGLTGVQLHGNESPGYINRINLPVIKSFGISDSFNFALLDRYKNCSFLLDTYSGNEIGGSGKVFNWNLIPDKLKPEIILAGGISISNIESIFELVKPRAVDLSSSLEYSIGKKDHNKVKEFFKLFNGLKVK